MYGNIIVQGIGRPASATTPGFAFSQNQGNKILFVTVPQTGNGNETPNFSLIAQGYLSGEGNWTMGIYLTEPPSNKHVAPTEPAIASDTFAIADDVQHGYVFEADIVIVNGVAQLSSPWTFTLDGTVIASGTCSYFPVYQYPVGQNNGEFTTIETIIRTLAFSFSAVSTAEDGSTLAYLQIAEAGYGAGMPITTVNASPNEYR